jgi:Glycosyl hydrolase family 79 C-terminal beta domain
MKRPLNITAYAVLGTDGKLRIALINKEQQKNVTVQLNTIKAYKAASLIRLTAPSLSAANGITFAGSTVATNGTWAPKTKEPATINHGTASVFLPAASALVVTFENGSNVSLSIYQSKASQAITQQQTYLSILLKQERQTVLLFLFSPSILPLSRQKPHTRTKSLNKYMSVISRCKENHFSNSRLDSYVICKLYGQGKTH